MGNTKPIHFSFDLDGTLIDSVPLMEKSWHNVCDVLKINKSWQDYKKNIGLSFADICKNLGLEDLENEISKVYFNFNIENFNLIKPMPGIDEFTKTISNIPSWSVITSKPRLTTCPILDNLGLFPTVIVTPDDVKKGKPNSSSAEFLRNKIGNKYDFYYVGDMLTDHLFAINSHFKFIRYEHKTRSQIGDQNVYKNILNPHKKVTNLNELANLINDLISN